MTVEATLVFTLVLFAVMAVVYSFMLMYQYTVVQSAVSVGASEYARAADSDREIDESFISGLYERMDGEMKKGLLSGKYDIDISYSDKPWMISTVEITVSMEVMKPISQIAQFFGGEAFEIKGYAEVGISGVGRRRSVIDSLDFICEIVDRVKKAGGDGFNKIYEKFLEGGKKEAENAGKTGGGKSEG